MASRMAIKTAILGLGVIAFAAACSGSGGDYYYPSQVYFPSTPSPTYYNSAPPPQYVPPAPAYSAPVGVDPETRRGILTACAAMKAGQQSGSFGDAMFSLWMRQGCCNHPDSPRVAESRAVC